MTTTAESQDAAAAAARTRRLGPTRIRSTNRSASCGPLQLPDLSPGGVLVVPRLRRGAAPSVIGQRPAEVHPRPAGDRHRRGSPQPFGSRGSCSSIRPITPGCASWSARRSRPRSSRRWNPTSPRWSTRCWTASRSAVNSMSIADLAHPAAGRGDLPAARRADRGRAAVQSRVGAACPGAGPVHHRSPGSCPTASTSAWRPGCGCASICVTSSASVAPPPART